MGEDRDVTYVPRGIDKCPRDIVPNDKEAQKCYKQIV